jgi:hypothetical protein
MAPALHCGDGQRPSVSCVGHGHTRTVVALYFAAGDAAMQTDRFLRIVLVVIALELLWIGLKDFAPPVTAQTAPMRVIISGVDGGFLPVALAGQTQNVGRDPLRPIQIGISGNVAIQTRTPLKIEADRPLKIEADRPLPVESVPYTPGTRPGD